MKLSINENAGYTSILGLELIEVGLVTHLAVNNLLSEETAELTLKII